jgi:hypothetical protein
VVYIGILAIMTVILRIVARARMGTVSIVQVFSILSYSQIYFIPFGFSARFVKSPLLEMAIMAPAAALQFFCAYRLSSLLVPADSERLYALSHLLYGVALLVCPFGR